jgi:hypothetical protein
MSLLNLILQAEGGDLIAKLAENYGVDSGLATKAIGGIIPALADSLMENLTSGEGLSTILKLASSGGFEKYLGNSDKLLGVGLEDGGQILSALLGGKKGIASVAEKGVEASGIDLSTVTAMLPAVASLFMGAVSQKASAAEGIEGLLSGNALDAATSILDTDGDGLDAGDAFNFAKKFF